MNFLVLFPIIATTMAASIPIEGSSVTGSPSLINSFPVPAEGRQGDFGWYSAAFGNYISVPIQVAILQLQVKLMVIECIFSPDTCQDGSSNMVNAPAIANIPGLNLQNFGAGNPQQRNHFDESVTGSNVNPINQRSSFPFAVSARWNPYVNIPSVARQNEMLNENQPSAGTFIPYFNSFARFRDLSFMNSVTQQEKVLTSANTVLETTPY